MRFSRSTHLLMCLSLENLTSIIRTGLPILVELIDLVMSVSISTTLLRWLTLLLGFLWIYFFLLTLVFVLQWLSLHWGNSNHVVVSVSIDFPSYSQRDALFHCIAYGYSRADWDGLRDRLRDVPWEDIFKLSASTAASEFCEWAQVGVDVYIPHGKYQIKPHSSPWFSAVCAAVIVHRNHFFCLYQKDKSSEAKVKFRQVGNHCKRALEAAKLAYANKTKESTTSQKLGS